jgi:predicted glycosyl hydrolase (DUF1957 family)
MTHNQPTVLRHCKECGKPIRANTFAHRKPKDKRVLLCQKCKLSKQIGSKNPNWKGDKAGYRAKQHRKERLLPPKYVCVCGRKYQSSKSFLKHQDICNYNFALFVVRQPRLLVCKEQGGFKA